MRGGPWVVILTLAAGGSAGYVARPLRVSTAAPRSRTAFACAADDLIEVRLFDPKGDELPFPFPGHFAVSHGALWSSQLWQKAPDRLKCSCTAWYRPCPVGPGTASEKDCAQAYLCV